MQIAHIETEQKKKTAKEKWNETHVFVPMQNKWNFNVLWIFDGTVENCVWTNFRLQVGWRSVQEIHVDGRLRHRHEQENATENRFHHFHIIKFTFDFWERQISADSVVWLKLDEERNRQID